MKTIHVFHTSEEPPVVFAAQELVCTLRKITGHTVCFACDGLCAYDLSKPDTLWVGLVGALPCADMPAVRDPQMDDGVYARITALSGIVAGVNPRSVLLCVYRFLTEAGVRWVRPGADGAYLPIADLSHFTVVLMETPSYRHRGVCIEGAVSLENVLDMVDFLPKIGMNAYFLQFREAYVFFERWYTHRNNIVTQPEAFAVEDARAFMRIAEAAIAKRGLMYHAVGHGWTCEPLGIPGLGWDAQNYPIPASAVGCLAQVNGVRALWGGVPLNTNLCYSNPSVQQLMVQSIVAYLREYPSVDILHFWLADDQNNQCECENCRERLPSDYFVQILNLLDERLTQAHISAKVVFLIYLDLLWPPESEAIKHPERFILMFAPITRTYRQVFSGSGEATALPPYVRNQLAFPSSADRNLAFLRAWQKQFQGDSFLYDYHLWWNLYNDPGHYGVPALLSRDLKNLEALGLNGYISCQVQRAFFPTGLGMAVLGKTLWSTEADFDKIATDFFQSAFGEDGPLCLDYLRQMSALFEPALLGEAHFASGADAAALLGEVPKLIRRFGKVRRRNGDQSDPVLRKSWQYLKAHAHISASLASIFQARCSGRQEEAASGWQRLKRYVSKHEGELQPVLDVFEFVQEYEKKLAPHPLAGEGSF